jgi:hypothetical protein
MDQFANKSWPEQVDNEWVVPTKDEFYIESKYLASA